MESTLPKDDISKTPMWAAESAVYSLKRSRILFGDGSDSVFIPNETTDDEIRTLSIQRRRRLRTGEKLSIVSQPKQTSLALVVSGNNSNNNDNNDNVLSLRQQSQSASAYTTTGNNALMLPSPSSKTKGRNDAKNQNNESNPEGTGTKTSDGILVNTSKTHLRDPSSVPMPTWHSPWKLSTVLSSHLGWVRCIGIDSHNQLFATGSADRTIKIWNLPKASVGTSDALQLTLTGHISPIRGLVFSERHPYLFSCAEDKDVKCWDLETNQVIRHYHGHLSGVYAISLHPMLDVLVTGGRDAVARVWDIRSKHQIHVLSGHEHTVSSIITKSTNPQVITGSHDCTVKLWDLAAGKCYTTLTHHSKAIRSLTKPSFENTFVSGAADCLKKWQGKDGKFLQSITEPSIREAKNNKNVIVHTVAVNDDGVLISGRDDGSIHCFDYQTGYNFQQIQTKVQPGSLQDAENAILTCSFDLTGTRLITGEADKSIKIYKQDDDASELTHPINVKEWRKHYIAAMKERY